MVAVVERVAAETGFENNMIAEDHLVFVLKMADCRQGYRGAVHMETGHKVIVFEVTSHSVESSHIEIGLEVEMLLVFEEEKFVSGEAVH